MLVLCFVFGHDTYDFHFRLRWRVVLFLTLKATESRVRLRLVFQGWEVGEILFFSLISLIVPSFSTFFVLILSYIVAIVHQ